LEDLGHVLPCGKHGNFITECPKGMEVKHEHKRHSRDDYKGENKSERRLRKSGGHKKERAMVAGASDIDLSSCYTSSSSSDEEENQNKGKRSSKNINSYASVPKAFAAWHIALQARRATRMTRAPTPRKR
jgi:hypothetical protein